jgi:hypothetical protein
MSAERDLLRRAKCLLECSNMEPLQRQSENIVEGIKELLAQPKREPLSDKEITDLWANKSPANEFECVRLVEKAHGIGEQK